MLRRTQRDLIFRINVQHSVLNVQRGEW